MSWNNLSVTPHKLYIGLQLLRLSSGADYEKMEMNGEVLDYHVPKTFQQYEKEGKKCRMGWLTALGIY